VMSFCFSSCGEFACSVTSFGVDLPFLQESELIESVEEEGKEDSPHSPMSEDKPKIQVSQHCCRASCQHHQRLRVDID